MKRTLTCCLLLTAALAGQSAWLRPASPMWMPGVADSNSPAHWWNGRLYLYNSDGAPIRSEGDNLFSLRHARAVLFYSLENRNRWIESTWVAPNGHIYAWYHHEDFPDCQGRPVSTPVIGALVSYDGGWTFHDFGNVLTAGGEPNCDAKNGYFAGGHGDFTVIPDEAGEYLYFHFSNYSGDPSQQGVAVARMRVEDSADPVGKVWKYFEGDWQQPGLGGEVTPIFPAAVDWGREDTDAFWGPSVHFNTEVNQYVMLLNRACCAPGWPQEGVYISYAEDLAQPASWKAPVRLADPGSWYPQVVGVGFQETDKRMGRYGRFFVGGFSESELVIEPE